MKCTIKLTRWLAALCLLSMLVSEPASAQSLYHRNIPDNATITDPGALARLLSGRTIRWEADSFAYFSSDGVFRAVNEGGNSLGVGEWFIVKNPTKLCFKARWYWQENFKTRSQRKKNCSYFVTTPDGELWERQIASGSSWLPFNVKALQSGDISVARYNAMVRKFGVDSSN